MNRHFRRAIAAQLIGWTVVAALVGLIAGTASAQSARFVELRRFAMEGYKIADHQDQYLPYSRGDQENGEVWRFGTAALFDLDLMRYGNYGLGISNRLHGEATTNQFREIGWEYELTAQLGRKLEMYWHHHSRHLMDAAPETRFPLDNAYGARITFFQR